MLDRTPRDERNMDQVAPEDAWMPFQPTQSRPWSNRLAAHLLRRAGFGGSIDEINAAVENGLEATVSNLLEFDSAAEYNLGMETSGRLLSGGQDSMGLAAWWLLRMVQTPCPLQEKMTLFWHGHFATGANKVGNARAMLRQNELLRANSISRFGPLVSAISRDVAMLIYLDSTENRKTRPNENYARELMELFCLGPGNYTEKDIKEIARCFTGWEVRRHTFKFNPYQHDRDSKSFLRQAGKFDGDDAIRIILEQPAASRFIAKKLIRFFVFDDQPIRDGFAEPVAATLRDSGFDIRAAVEMILRSQVFYSDAAIAKKIKSPVELAIGTLRFFDAAVNMQQLAERLNRLGQLPLYPPNVKGWDGGRSWINAATILARGNLIAGVLNSPDTTFASGSLKEWRKQHQAFGVGNSMDWINEYWLAEPLQAKTLEPFEEPFLKSEGKTLAGLSAFPEFQLN
jgi:hypothetical protein